MKKIFLILLSTCLFAYLFVGSPNIRDFLAARENIQVTLNSYAQGKQDAYTSNKDLEAAKSEFSAGRTFDFDYKDLEGISKLFNAVSGMKVKEVNAVSVQSGFTEVQPWVDTKSVEALRFTLECSNAFDALRVIQKIQLPVESIVWADGKVTLTVLSGQEVH